MYTSLKEINEELRFFLYEELYTKNVGEVNVLLSSARTHGFEESSVIEALEFLMSNGFICKLRDQFSYAYKTLDYVINRQKLYKLIEKN